MGCYNNGNGNNEINEKNIKEEQERLGKEMEQKKEEEEKERKEKNINLGSKKGNKEKNFELIYKMQFNKEKEEIYKVYELSDERLAVDLSNQIKIYSLKTFKLITEINHDNFNNFIELKNKNIALACYNTIYFYKLSGNNYINYLKLEEENKKRIFEIYELKNENLILCISHCLIIYEKKNEEYTFLQKFELDETVSKIIEIKNNVLFLFLTSRCGTYATADYSPYSLQLLNIETKKKVSLDSGCFGYWDYKKDKNAFHGCSFFIKNNKYLFIRYADTFCIYNFENDDIKKTKCIYKIKTLENIENFPSSFKYLCDYDDKHFIILPSRELYEYDEMANKIIKKKNFPIEIGTITDIIKLNNNYFIAYNDNEIIIFIH